MRRGVHKLGLACVLGACLAFAGGIGPDRDPDAGEALKEKIDAATRAAEREAALKDPKYVLAYDMKSLEGKWVPLERYRGKVVLIVNTATACGYTPQFGELEKLYRAYKDRGLVVLGFPSNDFRNQEPRSEAEIAAYCREHYDVTFPMFSKLPVLGERAHPLYKRLTAQKEPVGGAPKWNFTKFLVDREGRVVARFEPNDRPTGKKIVGKVEALLGPADAAEGETGTGG